MESNYYIYCITEAKDIRAEYLRGFDNRELLLLPYIDIWAVVSESDRTHYAPTLENLECHESVINHFLEVSVVLPMRFSTIVKSLDDVKRMLEKYYTRFRENIQRVRGKAEMGIKIFCNINSALQCELKADLSGREYFLKKYNSYIESKNKLEPYLNLAGELHNRLLALSRENCCINPFKNNLIMNASYLVPYENMENFNKAVYSYKQICTNFRIILSGPWPPYHFVMIEGD